MPDNRTLLERRRGLCLRIAEAIDDHFDLSGLPGRHAVYDRDEAAHLIDDLLPMTYAEAEAEMAETAAMMPLRPPGPSLPDQLRAALGLTKDVPLTQLLQSAIDAARERDRLTLALDFVECGQFRRGWLAEANHLWTARCNARREIDPSAPLPEEPDPGDPWLWLTRCRELLQVMMAAHAPLDGRDDAVAAASRRMEEQRHVP